MRIGRRLMLAALLPTLAILAGCGRSVPAKPANFVEPAPEHLKEMIRAFEALGARFSIWNEDPQVRGLPKFDMPKSTTDKDLAAIPLVPFSFALDIANSEVTDAGLKELHKQKYLWVLSVRPKITDEGCKEITKIGSLSSLYIGMNELTDASAPHLGQMNNLSLLHLFSTNMTDAALKDLKKINKLAWLDLAFTGVSDDGLKDIAECKNLTKLFLGHTKVTHAGAAAIRKALPKCDVKHQ